MTFDDYQRQAQRTSNTIGMNAKIENGCMGLCGEAGECMDILKKHKYQGHDLDRDKLIDEAGDVMWYLAELATGLGVSLDDIAQHNIDKLWCRFPEGFDSIRSIRRPEYEEGAK
jgi:NTP pyrophosphatase (non-canonical NTP hydrolase)